MKFKYLSLAMFLCTMVPSVFALSVRIPALDRVRTKVNQALQEGSTALVTQGNNVLTALGIRSEDKSLQDIEKTLESLSWSNQYDVVTTVLNLKKNSAEQAAQFLKDVIKKKCVGSASALMAFAHELANEEQKLQEVFNQLLKSLGTKKLQGSDAVASTDKLRMLFDQHSRLAQNLQQLIDESNALLMS